MPRKSPSAPSVPLNQHPSQLHVPSSSEGFPPTRRLRNNRDERRRANPVQKKGRPRAEKVTALVAAAEEALATGAPAHEVAVKYGVDASGRSIKELLRAAKEQFNKRAEFYANAHALAAAVAAQKGDGEPAQWALERLGEDGQRVVETPKSTPPAPPTVMIGVRIGGLPAPASQPQDTAVELPKLDSTPTIAELMP